jgi:hypothetical protein
MSDQIEHDNSVAINDVSDAPLIDGASDQSNQLVKYESYRRAVSESKKAKMERDQLRAELDQIREKQAIENNQKGELAEIYKSKCKELESKLNEIRESEIISKKYFALKSQLPSVEDDYLKHFVDPTKIQYDEDSDEVVGISVAKYAEELQTKFPKLFVDTKNRLPNEAPRPVQGLTYKEWLMLPAKEMIARQKDVID